jgi:CelD/BcsL family acetyltransferase involved in cellulose biosynthesis
LEIIDFEHFRAIKEEWNNLVMKDPTGTIFDTWEWLWCFWKTHKSSFPANPLILTYRENNKLKGAAAFRLANHSIEHLGRFTSIEFLAQGPSDYNTILVDPDSNLESFAQLLRNRLLESSPSWDVIRLENVSGRSQTSKVLFGWGFNKSLFIKAKTTQTHFITLPKTWEEYFRTLGRRLRKEIKGDKRRLESDYADTSYQALRNPTDNDISDLLELHTQRMRRLVRTGILGDHCAEDFHKEFARQASAREWLRLHIIKSGKKTIASNYDFAFKGRFLDYNGGFNPVFEKYSPSTQLIAMTIKDSIEEGLIEYDFLRGTESCKFHWARDVRNYNSVDLVHNNPRSLLKVSVSLFYPVVVELRRGRFRSPVRLT